MRDYSDLLDMIDGDYLVDEDIVWHKIWMCPWYYVNEYGDVATTRKGYIQILKPWQNQHGHLYVQLRDRGFSKKVLVHRLVAEEFVYNPRPDKYFIVRHLDDDPTNNYYQNLAWGTQADNCADCRRNGHMYMKEVYCPETDIIYESCAEAAKDLGVSRSLITLCCEGKVKIVLGKYHFCYLDDKEKRMNNYDDWMLERGNYKPVTAINLETGEKLFFASRKEASRFLGMGDSGISNVLAGRISHSKGWTFVDGRDED